MNLARQQLVDRDPQPFAGQVVEGHVDGGLRRLLPGHRAPGRGLRVGSEIVEPRTVCMRTKNLPIVCGPWLKASRSASSTSWATCG